MLWVLIPAKPTWLAKRRLAPVLGAAERATLHQWLVTHTLAQVYASGIPATVLVITADSALATLVRHAGATVLLDPPGADLNVALEAGRATAVAQGATSILVLPTDLPYLTPDALTSFLAHAPPTSPSMLIAPDHQGTGTNALLLRPAEGIPFAFGIGSAALHRAAAQRNGLAVAVYHNAAFAHDLDMPQDYHRFAEAQKDISYP